MEKKQSTTNGQLVDTNSWMVTFSDLITLLLTFFVLLISMSSMDQQKLREILIHMGDAAGVLELSKEREIGAIEKFIANYTVTENKFIVDQNAIRDMFKIEAKKKLKQIMPDVSEAVGLADDERGIIFYFQDNIFFDPGRTTIKKEGMPVLDMLAATIASCDNDILIMGHTDDIPIKDKLYETNWELSSYRGLAVLEYFIKQKNLSAKRFSVGGYGPSRPLYPNASPKHRAMNRRVEIIFRHAKGV